MKCKIKQILFDLWKKKGERGNTWREKRQSYQTV